MKDSITKYVIYTISYLKNIEYDLNNISKKIDTYQRKNEIDIQKELDGKIFLSILNFENLVNFIETEYDKPD